jgi:hypothetical protein
VQFAKAPLSILLAEGISIVLRDEHPIKQYDDIHSILFDSFTVFKFLQLRKQLSPIYVTVLGMDMDFRLSYPEKTGTSPNDGHLLIPIPVMGCSPAFSNITVDGITMSEPFKFSLPHIQADAYINLPSVSQVDEQ